MKLLCFMLAAVVLVTGCAFAEDNGGDALESILSGMTLREKAAQMMIASFRTWKEVPETEEAEQPAEEPPAVKITELNDEIRDMFHEFKRNAVSCKEITMLTESYFE